MMKKIAYIISAYTDAPQLLRLVERLSNHGDFYVHVDAKIDDTPFRQLLDGKVHFVPRHWISWGGWSQVEYHRELLTAVIQSGENYSHIVCLSGLDYPLWSPQSIVEYFNENPDCQFIAGYNMTAGHFQFQYITHYHFFRDLEWHNQWLKNKFIVASRWLMKPLWHKPPQVLIDNRLCDIYKGSDYWAITPDCACYVVEKLRQKPLCRYFKTSFVPSEMCLQTIIFNSPFAAQGLLHPDHNYPGLTHLSPLHFIDYNGAIKILDESDYSRLFECGRMFCRKVVTGTSDRLVQMINSRALSL